MFVRNSVWEKGLPRKARAGDGWMANPLTVIQAADSNQTIPVASILGGIYRRVGITVGRTDTTATAVDILASMPDMDVGDAFMLLISNGSAQILTIAGGVGVTANGTLTIPATSSRWFALTKTSATTMTATGL